MVTAVAWSVAALSFHDGMLVSGSYDATVRIWRLESMTVGAAGTPDNRAHHDTGSSIR